MFIPKSKMSLIEAFIDAGLESPLGHSLDDDDIEIIHQIRDRASLCKNGDANFLEVEVCYAHKPE